MLQSAIDTMYQLDVAGGTMATTATPAPASVLRNADAPAVALRDVTVGYDGPPVLAQTTLEIGWGQLVGVIGPNGAGKSTLIKTILGTLRPMGGTVTLGGWPAHSREARNLVGY